jgi:integrase
MRSRELAGLRWQDIDFALGTISVRQAFLRVGREYVFKGPKSKTGRRTISLASSLLQVLRDVQAQQREAKRILGDGYCDQDLVFCQGNGKPLWMRAVLQRDFYPLLERSGLPRVTMHSLRHSSITIACREGIDLSVIQRRVGHSSLAMIEKVYRHVHEEEERDAARRLDARLQGAS